MAAQTQRRARRPIVYRAAVLPYKPPIDKIGALALVEMYLNETGALPLKGVQYYKKNEVSDEQYAEWNAQKVFVIDVGPKHKYHQIGVGSATQKFVDEYIEATPDVQELVDLINRNNATGFLKGFKWSVAQWTRELYELTDDESEHLAVIDAAVHVIQTFMRAFDADKKVRDIASYETGLPDVAELLKGSNYAPLTLGQYARNLWVQGEKPTVIQKRIAFWMDRISMLETQYVRGDDELTQMLLQSRHGRSSGTPMIEFEIPADQRSLRCVAIQTDDRFLSGAAIRKQHWLERAGKHVPKWELRVVMKSTGHTVVSTTGLDLSAVAAALQKAEPGRWYYQPASGALINGGPQYVEVQPTSMSLETLVQLFKFNAPKRREQKGGNRPHNHQGSRQQSARA